MANLPIHSPKDYSEVLRILEVIDPVHANTLNPIFERLINNDSFLRNLVDAMKKKLDGIQEHPATHPATMITINDPQGHFSSKEVNGALLELFTSADSGKKLISSAIGSPASSKSSFSELAGSIQTSKTNLAANLTNKGQSASGSESLASLVEKVINISTAPRSSSGYILGSSGSVNNLAFRPRIVLVKAERTEPSGYIDYRNKYKMDYVVTPDAAYAIDYGWICIGVSGGTVSWRTDLRVDYTTKNNITITNQGFSFRGSSQFSSYDWTAYE